jgi:HSP20 family protein
MNTITLRPLISATRSVARASSPRRSKVTNARNIVTTKAFQEEGKEKGVQKQSQKRGNGGGSDIERRSRPESGMLAGSPFFGSLSPYAPARVSSLFREMEDEMNNMMRAFGGTTGFLDLPSVLSPATASAMVHPFKVDIKDTPQGLEIIADTPGLSKEDIKVKVSPDNVLTLSGERKEEKEEKDEEGNWTHVERSYGSFMRRFKLPDTADVGNIKAEAKNGVLHLSIPKTSGEEHKQVEIPVE